jgi:hypothetical protein
MTEHIDPLTNASAMCRAYGKRWADYWRDRNTQEFLALLSAEVGVPVSELVQVKQGEMPQQQDIWVPGCVALHLEQWCSPRFAVEAAIQAEELLTEEFLDDKEIL